MTHGQGHDHVQRNPCIDEVVVVVVIAVRRPAMMAMDHQ
jgi:hypothetical protein